MGYEKRINFLPHIEMTGNREAEVEGCRSVLQYNEGIIELDTGKLTIRFTGCDLTMSVLDSGFGVINGRIMTVEFL